MAFIFQVGQIVNTSFLGALDPFSLLAHLATVGWAAILIENGARGAGDACRAPSAGRREASRVEAERRPERLGSTLNSRPDSARCVPRREN